MRAKVLRGGASAGPEQVQAIPAPAPIAHYFALIGATLLLQLALVSWTFPLRELLTAKPLFWIDSAYHWYQMTIAVRCGALHALVCYDPTFAAGYPAGVTYNWSAKFPALAAWVASPLLDVTQTYKLYAFVSAVLGPACIPIACRIFRRSVAVAVVATCIGLILWWASMMRWYQTAGMVSFVLGSFAAAIYVACLWRLVTGPGGWRRLLGLAAAGAIAMFYHPLFAIPVGFAIIGLIATFPEMRTLRGLLSLAMVATLSLLPNLLWIVPMVHFQQLFGIDVRIETPYQQAVDLNVLWQELIGWWQGNAHGSKLYAPIALAAAWACATPNLDPYNRRLACGLALGAIGLAVFAAAGATVPAIAGLQPNRFLPVAYLLLVIPASIGVVAAFGWMRRRDRPLMRSAAFAVGIVVVAAAVYGGREVVREVSYGEHPRYGETPPEVKGVGTTTRWLEAWLRSATDPSARVLFETSPGRDVDQTHITGYLAAMTGRELIGGPYPYQHFASFWDHTAFRRPIESFSPEVFEQYLRTYNVGWMVVYTERSRSFLNRLAYVEPGPREGEISTYRVNLPFDYFLKGAGDISVSDNGNLDLNRIVGDEVILKYHFVDGLRAEPPAQINGIHVLDDPNPFIRIVHPPSRLTLSLP